MKGIILAAGKGTRLGAATCGIGSNGVGVSKPLIPTYDKPTIYYPLSDLISAGINDILIIAAPNSIDQFRAHLGDGTELGISIQYAIQDVPRGTADAFLIAEEFIGNDDVALIFGDNIFSSSRFAEILRSSTKPEGATVFAYQVPDPQDYGVVEFSEDGRAISIEEKPAQPKSDYAVVGVYFYTNGVIDIAKQLTPSDRGELEITDVNKTYLEAETLNVVKLDTDTEWFDTGTPKTLLSAANYVEKFQGENEQLLGSPEAAAYTAGFINSAQLTELAKSLIKSEYGRLLHKLANTN
ncbi:MAG: sugar nucleotidyltransferase [Candidatus Microsaccharimonas sp.]